MGAMEAGPGGGGRGGGAWEQIVGLEADGTARVDPAVWLRGAELEPAGPKGPAPGVGEAWVGRRGAGPLARGALEAREAGRRAAYRPRRFTRDLARRLQLMGRPLESHDGCVNRLAWSEDGTRLASVSDDTLLAVWEFPELVCDHSLHGGHGSWGDPGSARESLLKHDTGHTLNIFGVRFLPQSGGGRLVTGAMDAEVRLISLDAQRGVSRTEEVYRAHEKSVQDVEVERGGSPWLFWSCSMDGCVRQYDTRVDVRLQDSRRSANVLIGRKSSGGAVSCLSVNPAQPHQIAIGCGNHPFVQVFDRRKTSPRRAGPGHERLSLDDPIFRFCPPHIGCLWKSNPHYPTPLAQLSDTSTAAVRFYTAPTSVKFGSSTGHLLCSYCHDHTYRLDLKEPPRRASPGFESGCDKIRTGAASCDGFFARERQWSEQYSKTRRTLIDHVRAELSERGMPRQGMILDDSFFPADMGLQTVMAGGALDPESLESMVTNDEFQRVNFFRQTRGLEAELGVRSGPRDRRKLWSAYRASGLLHRSVAGDAAFALKDLEKCMEACNKSPDECSWPAHYLRAKGLYMLWHAVVVHLRKMDTEQPWTMQPSRYYEAARILLAAYRAARAVTSWPTDWMAAPGGGTREGGADVTTLLKRIDDDMERMGLRDLVAGASTTDLDELEDALNRAVEGAPKLCGAPDVGGFIMEPPGLQQHPRLPPRARDMDYYSDCTEDSTGSYTDDSTGSYDSLPTSGLSQLVGSGSASYSSESPILSRSSSSPESGDPSSFYSPSCYFGNSAKSLCPSLETGFDGCFSELWETAGRASSVEECETRPGHSAAASKYVLGMWGCGGGPSQGEGHMGGADLLVQRYVGARNDLTDIKESTFLGAGDELVACASDLGHVLIFDAETAECVNIILADSEILNCVVGHPFQPVLATSGIDSEVRVWAPGRCGESSSQDFTGSPTDATVAQRMAPSAASPYPRGLGRNQRTFTDPGICDVIMASGTRFWPRF